MQTLFARPSTGFSDPARSGDAPADTPVLTRCPDATVRSTGGSARRIVASMDESNAAIRWRTIAGTFSERTTAVRDADWDSPTPCEGWVARDIIRHLVDWIPPFLATGADIAIESGPSVDVDPAAAWGHLARQIQDLLESADIDDRVFDHPQAGQHQLATAIERFILGDVFIHTWDLARATGQDETLDAAMAAGMLDGLAALGDALQQSGHYGPRVAVDADADDQTRLLALTGRRP